MSAKIVLPSDEQVGAGSVAVICVHVPAWQSIGTVNLVTNSSGAGNGLADGAANSVPIKSDTNTLKGRTFEYYDGHATKVKSFSPRAGTGLERYTARMEVDEVRGFGREEIDSRGFRFGLSLTS